MTDSTVHHDKNIRKPAVSGMFYPAERTKLHAMIQGFLEDAEVEGGQPKAIIAPHAGYIYSGPIAASAYARLLQGRETLRKVILLGPSHRVGFSGLAVSNARSFETPLGDVPLDKEAIAKILALPFVHAFDQAHQFEHSLEVHLPFLQEVLTDFELVPIVVGDAEPSEISAVLELLWGGPETVIVISSDLSHYHPYDEASRMDKATSNAIVNFDLEGIGFEDACGRLPVAGLLLSAKKHGLKPELLDLRNSGDTAGDKERVVGYGAYAFE